MTKILLVEDNRDLSFLTKAALNRAGYKILICQEGQEAIEEAKREKPDLILMDMMLPDMSGGEAVEILHNDADLKHVPVIFLTALISRSEVDLEETGINVEGSNYKVLGKPFEIDDLLTLIKNTLSKDTRINHE